MIKVSSDLKARVFVSDISKSHHPINLCISCYVKHQPSGSVPIGAQQIKQGEIEHKISPAVKTFGNLGPALSAL